VRRPSRPQRARREVRSCVTAGLAVGTSRSRALPDLPILGVAGGSVGRGLVQIPFWPRQQCEVSSIWWVVMSWSGPIDSREVPSSGGRGELAIGQIWRPWRYLRGRRVSGRDGGLEFARARDAGPIRKNQSAIRCTSGRPLDAAPTLGWAETERSGQWMGRRRAGLECCVCCCFPKSYFPCYNTNYLSTCVVGVAQRAVPRAPRPTGMALRTLLLTVRDSHFSSILSAAPACEIDNGSVGYQGFVGRPSAETGST